MNMSIEAQKQLRAQQSILVERLKVVTQLVEDVALVEAPPEDFRRRARILVQKHPPSDGPEHMMSWNKTWRPWVFPVWFRKACQHWLKKRKLWIPYRDPVQTLLSTDNNFKLLFEHPGTIGGGPMRSVVLQPFGGHAGTAMEFAEAIDVRLEIVCPGIWHPDTTTYIFHYGLA